jgi:hypothetical protein
VIKINKQAVAKAKLIEKLHNLAEYWRAQAQYWDKRVKLCREKEQEISDIRRKLHGKDSTRES